MFWGVILETGKRYAQKVDNGYHLTMAALDLSKKKDSTVSLVLEQNKTEFILCNLDYDKTTHQQLDLVFDSDEEVTFYLNGDGVVHLTGYVLPEEFDLGDEEDDESLDDEEMQDLKDLKSVVDERKRKAISNGAGDKKLKVDDGNKKAKLDAKVDDKKPVPEKDAKAATPAKKEVPAPKKAEAEEGDDSDEFDEDDESDEDISEEALQKMIKDKKLDLGDDDEDDEELSDDLDEDDDDDDGDEEEIAKYKEQIKKNLSGPKGIMKAANKGTPAKQEQQQKFGSGKKSFGKPGAGQQQQKQQFGSDKKKFGKGQKSPNQMNGKGFTPNKSGGNKFSPGSGKKSFKPRH